MQQHSYVYISDSEYHSLRDYILSFKYSKTKCYKLFLEKRVFLNDKVAKENDNVKKNDIIKINDYIANHRMVNGNLNIIYEDDNTILINKSAGLLVHSDGNDKITLDDYVAAKFPEIPPMHVHRLDIDTTGIIMYALDPLSFSFYNDALTRHEIKRTYICLCEGIFKVKKGKINKAISTDRHINGKMVVCKNGKEAITNYEVIAELNGASLVRINLETGRTHQIRVHMSYLGHPLVGDSLYGAHIKANRVMLHSQKISFYQPFLKKQIVEVIDLPIDMKKLMKEL